MNSALAMLIALIVAFGGYYIYAKRIDEGIIQVDPKKATPAKMYMDGVDFMPTSRHVLFGYQFKSIAALGPVVGPITALQWGWLPALAWLVLGVLFFGWVQDYSSAILALRNEGQSFGALSYRLISPRGRLVLLAFIYFYLILIIAAFGDISASVMANIKSLPFAIMALMVVGVLTGYMIYKKRIDILLTTVIMVILAFISIWLGTKLPIGGGKDVWLIFALFFCYLGAVLPIWSYTQPINYISFYLVFIGIIAAVIGIFVGRPAFTTAPFITWNFGAGPLWPLLFVTVACGAISGWHSLVSSSGTARQLEKETDTRYVAAGSMFAEMVLGVLALIIAAATFADFGAYKQAFGKGAAFVFATGMSKLLGYIGVSPDFGRAFAGAMFLILAITVMQLVTRFARVAAAELAGDRIPTLKNPHVGAIVALLITYILIKTGTWIYIWVLFGGSNQLMAALALLLVSIWLVGERKAYGWAYYPMWFMLVTTISALLFTARNLVLNVGKLQAGTLKPAAGQTVGMAIGGNIIAAAIALFLVVAALILAYDGLRVFNRRRAEVAGSSVTAKDH